MSTFRRASALDASNADALRGASDAAAGANRQADHRNWLEGLAKSAPANAAVRVELSACARRAAISRAAIAAATDAQRLAPDDPRTTEQLASVFADMGDVQRLAPLADPAGRPLSGSRGGTGITRRRRSCFAIGRPKPPTSPVVWSRRTRASPRRRICSAPPVRARISATARRPHSRARFDRIRASPRATSTSGCSISRRRRPANAAESFGEALALDPASEAARDGLRQARARASHEVTHKFFVIVCDNSRHPSVSRARHSSRRTVEEGNPMVDLTRAAAVSRSGPLS